MSDHSYKIGWIIKTNSPADLLKKAEDDNGLVVPDEEGVPLVNEDGKTAEIEIDPNHDFLFVSMDTLTHGYPLDGEVEPRGMAIAIDDYIRKLDPSAKITFGVIQIADA